MKQPFTGEMKQDLLYLLNRLFLIPNLGMLSLYSIDKNCLLIKNTKCSYDFSFNKGVAKLKIKSTLSDIIEKLDTELLNSVKNLELQFNPETETLKVILDDYASIEINKARQNRYTIGDLKKLFLDLISKYNKQKACW